MAIRKQAMDEMHHTEWLIERIIFFDGAPTVSKLNTIKIGKTVSEMISNDSNDELDAVRVRKLKFVAAFIIFEFLGL